IGGDVLGLQQLGYLLDVIARPVRMVEDIGLIVEMIDGDDVLVDGVKELRDLQVFRLLFQGNLFKILYSVIGDIPKQTIVDELKACVFHLEFLRELVDLLRKVHVGSNTGLQLRSIGKFFCHGLLFNPDGGNGIAADIGKTVPAGVVVAALEQQAVRKLISQSEIYAYRRDGIGEEFFICGLKFVHLDDFSA